MRGTQDHGLHQQGPASSGKAADAPLSERDEKILDAILLEARKNHGDANAAARTVTLEKCTY